jgi:Asp-tRNA(Asn)/Glu-tRNA(Gln) amidotransferase B subunit
MEQRTPHPMNSLSALDVARLLAEPVTAEYAAATVAVLGGGPRDAALVAEWVRDVFLPAVHHGPYPVSPRLLAGIIAAVRAGHITRQVGRRLVEAAALGDVAACERALA